MANISASMVKELRDITGAGMMDCKAALGETSGNVEAAVDWLRKKGLSKAAKKAGRVAAEGLKLHDHRVPLDQSLAERFDGVARALLGHALELHVCEASLAQVACH